MVDKKANVDGVETASNPEAIIGQILKGLRAKGLPAQAIRLGEEPYPVCKTLNLHTVGFIASLLRRAKAPAAAFDALLTSTVASTMGKVLDLGLILAGRVEEAQAYGYDGLHKPFCDRPHEREMILNLLSALTGDDFARQAPLKMAEKMAQATADEAKGPEWVDDVLADDERPFDPFGNEQPPVEAQAPEVNRQL